MPATTRTPSIADAPEHLTLDCLATPIGDALVVSDESGRLRALEWRDHESRLHRHLRLHCGPATALRPGRAPRAVTDALAAYFDGELLRLRDIDCAPDGTAFQRALWAALRDIPPGHTLSYGALAARLGRPQAGRAVGSANGANPIGVVVPCHRLVGSDGTLTGYGGGLERKRWLLAHEGVPFRNRGRGGAARVARAEAV